MATVNSNTYEKQQAAKITLDPGIANSTIHVMSTVYEANALAANDTINLFTLPKGAVIHGISAAFDKLGTGTTLDIGDSVKADRYIDGADTATAAGFTNSITVDGMGYVIGTNEGDNVVLAKNLGAAATGTIKVTCFYAV